MIPRLPSMRHAAFALALGLGGIGVLAWSGRALDVMVARAAHAGETLARSAQLRAAMRQLDAAVALALPRYRELAAAGIVGAPRPQDWQERVRETALKHRVELVDTRFLPPRPLPAAADEDPDSPVTATPLALRAHLLHEGEFAGFIADLQTQPGARVRLAQCALERLAPVEPAAAGVGATLALDCRLDWLTIGPVPAGGER